MSRRALGLTALGLSLAAGWLGCVTEPDVGPPLTGTCVNADSDPDVTISFSIDIRPLLNRTPGGCSCHLPSSAGQGPGTQISGLNLSTWDSMRAGGVISGARAVVENQPCASLLPQKLSSSPPFGSRMPLNGPPFFTDDELQLVRDWIFEGAQNN